jgi:4-hydroxy-3-polyprenylbenzoate decarboxylase
VPYGERFPQELLTIANAVLGYGQASLAKYLMIVAAEDDPGLSAHDVAAFLGHLLARVDWRRDLHFHTRTTLDTLDYSGTALNEGSKLVIAAAGAVRRRLAAEAPSDLTWPAAVRDVRSALPGILVLEMPPYADARQTGREIDELTNVLHRQPDRRAALDAVPLLVLVDDAAFTARSLDNLLWVTFTRSNPSHDVHGIASSIEHKHWGCAGPLVIDARIKPHHAPPLIEDPATTRRVDALGALGGPLHGVI